MRRGSLTVLVTALLLLAACGTDSPEPGGSTTDDSVELDQPTGGDTAAQELIDLYVTIGYGEDLARCYAEAYGADGAGVDTQEELNALIAAKGASHLGELASCDASFGG